MLGGLWYSPVLFANAWVKAIGLLDEELAQMKKDGPRAKPFIISFLGALVMALVTAHMVDFMKVVFVDSGMSFLAIGLTSAFWL